MIQDRGRQYSVPALLPVTLGTRGRRRATPSERRRAVLAVLWLLRIGLVRTWGRNSGCKLCGASCRAGSRFKRRSENAPLYNPGELRRVVPGAGVAHDRASWVIFFERL